MKTSDYSKERIEILLKSTFPDANWQVACPIFCDCNDTRETKTLVNPDCPCRTTDSDIQCEVCKDQHVFAASIGNLRVVVYTEFKWNEDLQKNQDSMILEVAIEWSDEYEMIEFLPDDEDWEESDIIDLIMSALDEEQTKLEQKVSAITDFRNTYKR